MNPVLLTLGWLITGIYLTSFTYYFHYFKKKRDDIAVRIRVWLLTAVALHTGYLVLLSVKLGHLPVGDIFKVLTTCAWFFTLVYLVLEVRLKEMTMGLFFMPIILILHSISNVFIDFEKPLAEVLTDVLFEVHVAVMLSAYAAFSISFISSILYILLSREIQSKKLGIFFERLPSLEFFDKLSNQAVNIGLLLGTIGIGLGFYMGMNVWEGSWALDPKLLTVLVAWAIYLMHFITRKSIGWQGRRAAIVSVIGYNWLLFSFLVASVFFSKFHSFK